MYRVLIVIFCFGLCLQCRHEPASPIGDLTHVAYNPVRYHVQMPPGFPQLEEPSDNLMTVEGVMLGRKLFYDPVLSRDSTISCSSCHRQEVSFKDNLTLGTGIEGRTGRRSSMSLLNVGLHYNGLFWDGRVTTLEEQALHPVEDPLEMDESWPNVEEKLRRHPDYPTTFRRAFGITSTQEISRDLVAKALAQFQRTLLSSGQSKFDRFMRGEIFLDENEYNGFDMFFDLSRDLPDAECLHCHAAPLFTTNEYLNNGIEPLGSVFDFPDKGRGEVTDVAHDMGTFKVPTLYNIALMAPYMHDGRFETLEEVLDHYNSGGHRQEFPNQFIYPLGLTEGQKQDIIAFLHTLTDSLVLQNEDFSNPFH